MTSVAQLIKWLTNLKGAAPLDLEDVRATFLAPTLHVDLVSGKFAPMDQEERLEAISAAVEKRFGFTQEAFYRLTARVPVVLSGLTPTEAGEKARWVGQGTANSWVSWFLDDHRIPIEKSDIPGNYVHFYGYKGGQARSSVLALFAKMLADDGYTVLVVDADTEAPSLDALFGTYADSFSQTVMGLCGWSEEFQPIPAAYVGKSSTGRIDLLPCRPRKDDSDLDFALLVATAPLDIRVYERAAKRLASAIDRNATYDFVLMDHRTGIASSVLPLISTLPGPTAVFARPDSNIATIPSELRRVVRSIFDNSSGVPGAFVSFSLDPNRKSTGSLGSGEARAREALLEELAASIETNVLGGVTELVSVEELSLNWVEWYLDRALLDSALPDVAKLQADNLEALQKLREVLGLPIEKRKAPSPECTAHVEPGIASLSGARDEGAFIHIPDVDRLFTKGNPYTYILGRKGTGKTRLLREVAQRGLGTPILVAADESAFPALRSQSPEATEWLKHSKDPNTFWWSLVRLSLESIQANSSPSEEIAKALQRGQKPTHFASPMEIKSLLARSPDQRTLLVDGLETLVPAAEIKEFVAGLFGVMSTVQNDPILSTRLIIKAFVREDLASDSVQNIEQQIEGRVLRLKWSVSSILNFALSRLPQLPWITSEFPAVCKMVDDRRAEISRSGLSAQEATELLLMVFPARIRRNNLSTATFLRLYFSDAGGDDTNMATFYPRLYLSFLQKLDSLAAADPAPLATEHRLNSSLLNRAYDDASSEFISETKQELVHLLSLNYTKASSPQEDDQSKVTKFIAAFDGLSTPFDLDRLVEQLVERTPFSEASIRESLRRMKALRMFEDRPGYAGWWRVGQLYKMGLRMKYVR